MAYSKRSDTWNIRCGYLYDIVVLSVASLTDGASVRKLMPSSETEAGSAEEQPAEG
jgi:hypothetical protein